MLAKTLNGNLATIDTHARVLTADVAGAFDTYDSTDMTAFEGQQVPVDVARVCSWTWGCAAPPRGPNIHPNKIGYQVIANAFAQVIGRRLR